VPVSALRGDNIVDASDAMPWYQGEPLLPLLESLPVEDAPRRRRAALPGAAGGAPGRRAADDFRGYMGRVEAGTVRVGEKLRVLPANREASWPKC
jgi:sulfate adenylyltransferase subunit 1